MEHSGVQIDTPPVLADERLRSLYEHWLAMARERGCRILCMDDREYPERLRTLPDPPPVLYVRGDARWLAWPASLWMGFAFLWLVPLLALDDSEASVDALLTVYTEVNDPTLPHYAREALQVITGLLA